MKFLKGLHIVLRRLFIVKKINAIYQIFPDRFRIGYNKNLSRNLFPQNAVIKTWNELPESENSNHQFFGGNIEGIIEKLDYITELGIDTILLTPIFSAATYHRYDSLDYRSVDDSLGGFEYFDKMIFELKKRNMKIILDIALNHVSSSNPLFLDVVSNKDSKYRNYFKFKNYPNDYDCWWGFDYLPELNFENNEVLEDFITGDNSVIRFWAKKGIDGIRLDCANDLGLEIVEKIVSVAKEINKDIFITGEIFNYSAKWQKHLDSVQSYVYSESIYSLMDKSINSNQFGKNIENIYRDSDKKILNNSLSMLSSHDRPRILTRLKGDKKKYFQSVLMMFSFPGIPMIYYGEEVGMTGGADPHNRAPMIWDESKWNREIFNFYKKLIILRKEREELQTGEFIDLSQWLNNGVIAYIRYSVEKPKNFSIFIINPCNEKKSFRLFIPYSYLFSNQILIDIFYDKKIKKTINYIDIEIEEDNYSMYIPDLNCKKNYDFYKRVK